MRAHGIVEPAASLRESNVVLVKKKDGSLRFCVDYRQLNSVTVQNSYPLPLIDNCLNALQGSVWFSTLDLRGGYHNIPIAIEDRDKTTFITRGGCHCYTVMPFGLTGAPSVSTTDGLSFARSLLHNMSNLSGRYHHIRMNFRRTPTVTSRSFRTNLTGWP